MGSGRLAAMKMHQRKILEHFEKILEFACSSKSCKTLISPSKDIDEITLTCNVWALCAFVEYPRGGRCGRNPSCLNPVPPPLPTLRAPTEACANTYSSNSPKAHSTTQGVHAAVLARRGASDRRRARRPPSLRSHRSRALGHPVGSAHGQGARDRCGGYIE